MQRHVAQAGVLEGGLMPVMHGLAMWRHRVQASRVATPSGLWQEEHPAVIGDLLFAAMAADRLQRRAQLRPDLHAAEALALGRGGALSFAGTLAIDPQHAAVEIEVGPPHRDSFRDARA